MKNLKGLNHQIAADYLKKWEKEQSEKCLKEINEVLKKHNRKMEVILSMNSNEEIRKQIILTKSI